MIKSQWSNVGLASGVTGDMAKLFLDSQQLVVFLYPFTAGWRTGLEVAGVHRNRQVRDKAVHRFAAAMRNERRPEPWSCANRTALMVSVTVPI